MKFETKVNGNNNYQLLSYFLKNQSIPFVDILKNIFIIADYYTLWIAKLDLPHEHVSADQV